MMFLFTCNYGSIDVFSSCPIISSGIMFLYCYEHVLGWKYRVMFSYTLGLQESFTTKPFYYELLIYSALCASCYSAIEVQDSVSGGLLESWAISLWISRTLKLWYDGWLEVMVLLRSKTLLLEDYWNLEQFLYGILKLWNYDMMDDLKLWYYWGPRLCCLEILESWTISLWNPRANNKMHSLNYGPMSP